MCVCLPSQERVGGLFGKKRGICFCSPLLTTADEIKSDKGLENDNAGAKFDNR